MSNINTKRGLLPSTLLFITLLAEVILHFVIPIKMIILSPYRYFGVIFIIFGVVMNIWADALFKKHQTTVKPDGKPVYLVAEGPFRISRHPMYLGMLSILFGIAIILGSVITFISPVIFFVIMNQKFIRTEEESMIKEFGEKYYNYQKETKKWI